MVMSLTHSTNNALRTDSSYFETHAVADAAMLENTLLNNRLYSHGGAEAGLTMYHCSIVSQHET